MDLFTADAIANGRPLTWFQGVRAGTNCYSINAVLIIPKYYNGGLFIRANMLTFRTEEYLA